jgi:putative transposase
MPRAARASAGDVCYHVINRGNGRSRVFRSDNDYAAFVELIGQADERLPVRVLGFCVMPNHFHLVLWPHRDGDLGRYMQWLMTSQVRRHHRTYHSSGHVWQGRFKAFPVQADSHLLALLRYVERNPVRAKLVRRAQDWRWSSLWERGRAEPAVKVHPGPVERPRDWLRWVNEPLTDEEVSKILGSISRGSPYGGDDWARDTARRLGIESSLRPRGRPRRVLNDRQK